MKVILSFVVFVMLAASCQRFHTRVQVLKNESSDTLFFLNTGNGESEYIYPGATYDMAYHKKLNREEDGLPCNSINPNFQITNLAGKAIVKDFFDEDSWISTVHEGKNTEQECVFIITDADIEE